MSSNQRDRVRQVLQQIGELIEGIIDQPPSTPSVTRAPSSITTPTSLNQQRGQPNFIGLSGIATSPSQSPSVLAEVRRIIAPYPDRTARTVGRPTSRRSLVSTQSTRTWTKKFFCLSGPEDAVTPNSQQRNRLFACGLGERMIVAGTCIFAFACDCFPIHNIINIAGHSASTEEIKLKIIEQFPLLSGLEFELLRGTSGGYGKPLVRISTVDSIPNVQCLRSPTITTIYIRPTSAVVMSF